MHITKSDYLLYKQCSKSFWFQKNQFEIMENVDNNEQMQKRTEVTVAARELLPGGKVVPYSNDLKEMIVATTQLIESGSTTIYGAAFEFSNLFVVCDMIKKIGETWTIFEVKSSTGVKERHLDDAAFQFYVVANNLPVSTVSLVHINNTYVRQGKLDFQELFRVQDVSEEIIDRLPVLLDDLQKMTKIQVGDMPVCGIGEHCSKYGKEDIECAAKSHCWSHIPSYSIFNVARLGKKAFSLHDRGIVNIKDIPDDFKLSEGQRLQVNAEKHNIEILDRVEIREHLTAFKFPLYFLDFETFQQAIPLFDNLKPYQQIPFQYSLHIIKDQFLPLEHKEFLGEEGVDPRRKLATKLIKDIPKNVTTIAYNMSFEKKVLKDLSELFPEFASHLLDIHENMVDLMIPFQKKWYFTNTMKGKYSIKNVLPALLPHEEALNYEHLSIQNGSMAMNIYERLHTLAPNDIMRVRQDLLAYCHLDTLAMVKIWEVLRAI